MNTKWYERYVDYEVNGKWQEALQDEHWYCRMKAYLILNAWDKAEDDPDPEIRFEGYKHTENWTKALLDNVFTIKLYAIEQMKAGGKDILL